MERIDDTILMAYVDGELDDESAAAVEAHLENDADARAVVAMFRKTDGALKSAILPYGHAPVPGHLLDAIRSGRKDDTRVTRLVRPTWPRVVTALAASLALVLLGSGGGYLAADHRFAQLETARQLRQLAVEKERHEAVQTALTTLISGKSLDWQSKGAVSGRVVPLRTFKNKKGQYCREYRDELTGEDGPKLRFGIACRHPDKLWHDNYVLIPANQPRPSNVNQLDQ